MSTLPEFNGENYEEWISNFTKFLRYNKCEEVIARAKTDRDSEDWDDKDSMVVNYIYNAISEDLFVLLENKCTAFEIIESFDAFYRENEAQRKIEIKNKLEDFKIQHYDNLSNFLADFETIVQQLNDQGITMSEEEKFESMIQNLPESYAYLSLLLGGVRKEEKSIDFVKKKIKTFDINYQNNSSCNDEKSEQANLDRSKNGNRQKKSKSNKKWTIEREHFEKRVNSLEPKVEVMNFKAALVSSPNQKGNLGCCMSNKKLQSKPLQTSTTDEDDYTSLGRIKSITKKAPQKKLQTKIEEATTQQCENTSVQNITNFKEKEEDYGIRATIEQTRKEKSTEQWENASIREISSLEKEDIRATIREVTGGSNKFSDAVLQRSRNERIRKKENADSGLDSGDSNSSVCAFEDLLRTREMEENQKEQYILESNKKYNERLESLRLNSLIDLDDVDDDDDYHDDSFDLSESPDEDATIQRRTDDAMRNDRLCRLYESRDHEGVYYHPLMERIQTDKEWQNLGLKRRGEKERLTPRQYYMSIPDSMFGFQMPKNEESS